MRDLYRDMLAIRDPVSSTLRTLEGIEATVYQAGTTIKVTLYQGREGVAQLPNPQTTLADGVIEFYCEEGAYDVAYRDTAPTARITPTTKLWNAVDPVVDLTSLAQDVMRRLIPVGSIIAFGGVSPPDGWRFCDGSAVNRLEFNTLFDVIQTAYGAGNGTSTFNLPDLRGRVTVGVDGAAGRLTPGAPLSHADLLGQVGGVEAYALQGAETGMSGHYHSGNCPSHYHSGAAPDHLHYVSIGGGTGASLWGTVSRAAGSGTTAHPDHTHGVSVAGYSGAADRSLAFNTGGPSATAFNTGGPAGAAAVSAHTNMPPYQIVNYIIKY